MVDFGLKKLLAITGLALYLVSVSSSELKIDVVSKPEECEILAKNGDDVYVHYSGRLESNGEEFDSSYKRNTPLSFNLGSGRVIKGWDQGVLGMCVGEKRVLTIPHELGYGERGFPPVIPAKSTLIFDVELIGIGGLPKDEL
ncbi:FK506-binding protein 2 [Smittium mucronatum]|uniref:peptidylprolyl isomerase n=1 Tax=Smittium mucronatum TaxID=133383 RepID=A0A1R0H8M4_9FUNG|nr:FK506-binding protein 2 [Smittium mucronatum]